MSAAALDDAVTWAPSSSQQRSARMWDFMRWARAHHGVQAQDYRRLWRWSVEEPSAFWDAVRGYFDVLGEFTGPALANERMPGAQWYPGASVNFAENVLRWATDPATREAEAVREVLEDGVGRSLTWGALQWQVAALAGWLRQAGVRPGDCVVAVLPNVPEALVGLLAAASVGAVWSITSPDLSAAATVDRLAQLRPTVAIGSRGYRFNGRWFDRSDHLADVCAALPTLRHVVLTGLKPTAVTGDADAAATSSDLAARLGDAATVHELAGIVAPPSAAPEPPRYERLPFDHPLWVLFSSGTTGAPKGIVHGHGGILLEALKVTGLHFDCRPGDLFYVAANTSWMVWNLMVMNLAVGTAVVTYPGSPVFGGADRQFRVVAEQGVTHFGTGAAYLRRVQASGVRPADVHDLGALRSIMSTGSPLPETTWQWVHEAVKGDVHLGSDSGGTDICSAFIGSNPLEPVHRGWLQGPMLGAAVEVHDERGRPVVDEVGELVVTRPMPSMPLFLWGDADGEAYRAAYFPVPDGPWVHGDWVRERRDGRFQVLGRSDATLNRDGVRLGSADIYAALEGVSEVRESLVVGVDLPDGGYYLPLFVELVEGAELDDELRERISRMIRDRASVRHVPDEIVQAPAIPLTHAGKRVEVPVKKLFLGHPAERAVNAGSLANPQAMAWFVDRARAFRAFRQAPG